MNWQYTPYMLPLVAAAAIAVALALYTWRRRPTPGAAPFAVLMLAVAESALAYALELGGLDLSTIVLGLKAEYPGIVTVPVAWLTLTIEYTGRAKWLTRRNLVLLAVLPLVTLLLAWTNEAHGLIWRHIELESAGPLLVPAFSQGAWYWVNVGYAYALLLLGTLLLLQMLIRTPALYRWQAGVLLLGAMVPWVGNMLWVSGLSPFAHLDPTPFAFTVSGLVVAWGLFRHRLLDIVPVARDAVIEGMQDGVMVLDAQDRIVDLNPAAQRIIGRPAPEAIGQPIDIADLGLRIAGLEVQEGFQSEVRNPKSEMTFDLRISPLRDRRGRLTGRLIVLHDITKRQQAEDALHRRAEELAALHETGLDITAPHDLPTLLQTIVQRAARLLDAPGGGLYLCDPERQEVRCVVSFNTPRDYTGTVLKYGQGSAGMVAQTGEPLIIDDYQTWPDRAAVYEEEQPFTAVLSAPMIWQGQVTGVIHVLHDVEIRRFTQANLDLLTLFAQQVAIAVENARLLESERHHAEQLTALHETALDITAHREMPDLLAAIVTRAARLLNVQGGAFYSLERDGETLQLAAVCGFEQRWIGTRLHRGEGMAGRVLETGHPVIVEDYDRWERRAAVYDEGMWGSVLSVPVLDAERTVGVLSCYDIPDAPRSFGPEEVTLLEQFARQAAIAITNARLFEETRRRSAHLEALNTIIAATAAASGLPGLLEKALDSTLRALGLEMGAIWAAGQSVLRNLPPELGPAVAETSRAARLDPNTTTAVEDWQEQDGTCAVLAPVMARFGIRASLAVPVMAGEQRIGHLSLASPEPCVWSPGEVKLVEAVGRELGGAAERLRLFSVTREHAEFMSRLQTLSEALNRPLSVSEVLVAIGRGAMALSTADRAAVYVRHSGGKVTCPWSQNLSPAYIEQVTTRVREMPGGRLLDRTEPVLIPDAEGLPEDSPLHGLARTEGYRATGLWPLVYEGRVVAAVGCYYDSPHIWSAAEQETMEAFCRQAAVALENTRLFEEARRRADQMAIVHALGRQITPLLDADELLQMAAEALHERFGYLSVQLYLLDREAHDPSTGPSTDSEGASGGISGQVLEARGVAGEPGLVTRGYRQPVGQGITGRVAERGELVLIGDVSQEPDFISCVPGIRSKLALPIRVAGQVAGVLNVESEQLHGFDAADVIALESLAGQVGAALENARLYSAEQTRREELDTLYGLSRQLVATNDMAMITKAIARDVAQAVNVTFCRVLTLEEDGAFMCQAAHPVRFLGRDLGAGRPDPQPAQPYYRRAMAATEPQILFHEDLDLRPAERQALGLDVAHSLCLAPLRAGTRAVGLLALGEARNPAREPFDAAKLRLTAAIADQAASALHRARLHAQLEETYVQMVLALVNAVSARDAYTAGHSQRLVRWAETLARELGCRDGELETIRWAVSLHDIGKIGVPDHILQKPGPLANEERAVIERHPEIGERIVSPVKRLAHVAPIIRAHQERWDGQGYPDGLVGDAIPLEARILAVVDAYGAMTEDRVYRKAMSHAEAVAELRACAGTQFDPHVVEVFLRTLNAG